MPKICPIWSPFYTGAYLWIRGKVLTMHWFDLTQNQSVLLIIMVVNYDCKLLKNSKLVTILWQFLIWRLFWLLFSKIWAIVFPISRSPCDDLSNSQATIIARLKALQCISILKIFEMHLMLSQIILQIIPWQTCSIFNSVSVKISYFIMERRILISL